MPGPNHPHQSSVQQDTSGTQRKPQREIDRDEQAEDAQRRSGQPQDDRDPDSPRRGTQRPGESTSAGQRQSDSDVDEIRDVQP